MTYQNENAKCLSNVAKVTDVEKWTKQAKRCLFNRKYEIKCVKQIQLCEKQKKLIFKEGYTL